MSGVTLKDVVHHGVEGGVCIGLGAFAFSSLTTAAVVYGAGKVVYLGSKRFLNYQRPNKESLSVNRSISFVAGTVMSAVSLVIQARIDGPATNAISEVGKMLGVFGISLGARALCDKSFKHFRVEDKKVKHNPVAEST